MPVHPTAIIGKNVQVDPSNEIGPYVVIEDGVRLGKNNKIMARAHICTGVEMGDANEIHMGAIIGDAPQDRAYQGALTYTKIGSRNIIREYVTIHRGTKEGTATTIGDDNFLMTYVHLGHNCEIGNRVTIVNSTSLGGYVVVEDEAFISAACVFHQFTRVGRLAIVSGLSAVNKNVPPFMMCGGRGAEVHGVNAVGIRRAGFSAEVKEEIKRAYQLLYGSDLSVGSAVEEIERMAKSAEVRYLVDFIKHSKRGIADGGHSRESEAIRF